MLHLLLYLNLHVPSANLEFRAVQLHNVAGAAATTLKIIISFSCDPPVAILIHILVLPLASSRLMWSHYSSTCEYANATEGDKLQQSDDENRVCANATSAHYQCCATVSRLTYHTISYVDGYACLHFSYCNLANAMTEGIVCWFHSHECLHPRASSCLFNKKN